MRQIDKASPYVIFFLLTTIGLFHLKQENASVQKTHFHENDAKALMEMKPKRFGLFLSLVVEQVY